MLNIDTIRPAVTPPATPFTSFDEITLYIASPTLFIFFILDLLKEFKSSLNPFPLFFSKRNDFRIFCLMMKMINKGEHLTETGLRKLFLTKQKMH